LPPGETGLRLSLRLGHGVTLEWHCQLQLKTVLEVLSYLSVWETDGPPLAPGEAGFSLSLSIALAVWETNWAPLPPGEARVSLSDSLGHGVTLAVWEIDRPPLAPAELGLSLSVALAVRKTNWAPLRPGEAGLGLSLSVAFAVWETNGSPLTPGEAGLSGALLDVSILVIVELDELPAFVRLGVDGGSLSDGLGDSRVVAGSAAAETVTAKMAAAMAALILMMLDRMVSCCNEWYKLEWIDV
jgi:hypothetical protein